MNECFPLTEHVYMMRVIWWKNIDHVHVVYFTFLLTLRAKWARSPRKKKKSIHPSIHWILVGSMSSIRLTGLYRNHNGESWLKSYKVPIIKCMLRPPMPINDGQYILLESTRNWNYTDQLGDYRLVAHNTASYVYEWVPVEKLLNEHNEPFKWTDVISTKTWFPL